LRHKFMAAPLAPELVSSRGVKSLPVRKGDTVRIVRGDHMGFEGKVSRVDLKRYRIFLEGLTREKVDGTNIFVSVHPSKVLIKNLKLDDKWRKAVVERKKELAPPPKKEPEVVKAAAKPTKKEKAVKAKEEKPVKKPKAAAVAEEKLPEKKPAAKPKTVRKKPAAKKKTEEKPVAKKKATPVAKKAAPEKEKKSKAVKKAPVKRKTAASKKEGGT
jgi:large subunit ribosomal protein L24